ncbi:MAG: nucleotidyltransferase domain-containing protein [Bryobacteraceae bacterium]|nr:nucleotidyltransferase domain-containing protein [Bryobacteraceae bacterium]
MADVREIVLLDHMDTSRFRLPAGRRWRSKFKLALRWLVVATAETPLRHLYLFVYRLHVSYALRTLRRFAGIQSIYITGGVATDEIRPGISDIDLTVNGEWPSEQDQMKIVNALRGLSRLSPLYDTLLGQCVQTLTSLKSLCETDYFFQYRFNLGRMRWKLVYGDDVFSMLPPVPAERLAGGYYTEVRTWWSYFIKSAFGAGPMAEDAIFRRTIAYKTYAGILNMAAALAGGNSELSRERVLAGALAEAEGEEKRFLERLIRSAKKPHRAYDGDIQEDTFRHLLPRLEGIHARLHCAATFQPAAPEMRLDAHASEMLCAEEPRRHIEALVDRVKKEWSGYRAAFLVPSLSFFQPDDLALLLEADPEDPPRVRQIRKLCRWHQAAASKLKQRVALYLLLDHGAYQLEIVSTIELWRHLLCPAANPEVFALLDRPEFAVDGQPRARRGVPVWTRFAADLVSEEIMIRRGALAKIGSAPAGMSNLEVLRNLWRHLQLEIVDRAEGAVVPLTLPAMQRALRDWGLPPIPLFDQLREAYEAELAGRPRDIRQLIEQARNLFALFSMGTS